MLRFSRKLIEAKDKSARTSLRPPRPAPALKKRLPQQIGSARAHVASLTALLALSLALLLGSDAAKAGEALPDTYGGDVVQASNVKRGKARPVVREWAREYKQSGGRPDDRVLVFDCHGENNSVEGLVIRCHNYDERHRLHKRIVFYANVPYSSLGSWAARTAHRAYHGHSKHHKIFVRRGIVSTQFAYRPHAIGLSGDGTFYLYNIHWRHWGKKNATGMGRAYTRGCMPACANGRVFTPRAKVRLTRVVKCEGRYIFARLCFSLDGHVPTGYRHHGVYSMRPTNEIGEPAC